MEIKARKFEPYAYSAFSSPNDLTRQLQAILWQNQRETLRNAIRALD